VAVSQRIGYHGEQEMAMNQSAKPARAESPGKQLARFIAKFDPAVAKLVRSARWALRKRFPTAMEV
jgi:hypothetical protein